MIRIRKMAALLMWLLIVLAGLQAGAEATRKETTKGGKVVRVEWLDEGGALTEGPEGYAYATRSYSGTTVTEKYYDAAGNPKEAIGGYFGQMLTYGNKHRLEEIVYLNAKGQKAECTAGYARVTMLYNSSGKIRLTNYFDQANDLVMVPDLGYAALRNEYRGTALTRTTYLDEKKNPVDTPLGYAVLIQSVNKSNKVTGIRFEHADGSAAVCLEGWASCKRELDKKNREVSVKYYDLSGTLISMGGDYAYEEKSWSSDQVCVAVRYDVQGQRIPLWEGCVQVKREYNKDGQLIRETCLDAAGQSCEDAEGVTGRAYAYDTEGRLFQVLYLNDQGEGTLNVHGIAGYTETLDADGFLLERDYLGIDGKKANGNEGYCEIRYLYDEARQVIRKEYYDLNGTLIQAE